MKFLINHLNKHYLLIVQLNEKERIINNFLHKRNAFKLLGNLKLYQLNRDMTNSVEIQNLHKLHLEINSLFIYQENNKIKSRHKALHEKYPYLEIFCSLFSRIRTEYKEILRISP